MIVVTGSNGFIGGRLIESLENEGHKVKAFDIDDNHPDLFIQDNKVDFVIHLGAITDTLETDFNKLLRVNTIYSIRLWSACNLTKTPMIYASSAATYSDNKNDYAESKAIFDDHALLSNAAPPNWYGLKFFNVYGPGESHKGHMASMVHQIIETVKADKPIKLFKSHKEDYDHGEQRRDFIHIDDVIDVIKWLMDNKPQSGIYDVGTGEPATFNKIAKTVLMSTINIPPQDIKYIDMPKEIRKTYQYSTKADTNHLRRLGYNKQFTKIEEGIELYLKEEPVCM